MPLDFIVTIQFIILHCCEFVKEDIEIELKSEVKIEIGDLSPLG